MKEDLLVSCIITTFNRPDLVDGAITSVLNQQYENIELIIIDDCSKESYNDVISKYIQDSRVTYHKNQQNVGLSASRNNGIELANGAYIAFLDDDDVWLPQKLSSQVRILDENPEYVACSSSHIESESKTVINHNIREYTLPDIYIKNLIGPPSKLLIRQSSLENIRFDEKAKHAEDWDFYLKVLATGKIYSIKQPLIIYNTGHFERMTNGFANFTIEQIKEKAQMTYLNREKIGERNFHLRLTNYFFLGFRKRKNKIPFMFSIIKEVGLINFIRIFLNKTIHIIKRESAKIFK